ncbi:hypothetical protein C0995_001806, partial [Termitomyces sp. Mi166
EPKVAKEKLPPKDKGKKPMKPTVEEVPEESLPPIHPYSGIPEIQITEPTPKNATTADCRQDGAYKTLAPAATKEQEWTIKAFNTIWDHNIMMTVGGALVTSQPLRNLQEPRVDQYVLTTNKRIEYHQQELLKLQML